MDTRLVRWLIAGLTGLLLISPVQASPTLGPDQPPATPNPAEASGGAPAPGDDQQPVIDTRDTRPYTLDYELGQPIPPGYHVVSRPHRAQLTSGSIAFGISYTISIFVAKTRTEASSTVESYHQVPYDPRWLYVPIIGPLIALATASTHDCRNSYYASSYFYGQCDNANVDLSSWRAFLFFDTVVQGLGAYFTVSGITQRWYQLVLTDDVQVQVLPVPMGRTGEGLALVGRFRGL